LFVFFGSYGLLCYDLDGRMVWEHLLGPFLDEYGAGSSPVLIDGKIVLNQDHDIDSFLAAFDCATGKALWRTARPEAVRSYSTPAIWERNGRKELLVAGALEDRVAFGAPADSGLAFVFSRSGDQWVEEGNLISSDVPGRNRYGASVDIRGNTVVVGAQHMFAEVPGAVYVFTRQGSTWTQETKISPENNSGTFGCSVSLWGTSLAVGDWSASNVSVYERLNQNWQLQQTLAGASGTQFGFAVAQRGDRLLVGAPRSSVGGVVTGAAFLYGFDDATSTWTLNQTLEPADGQSFDLYGTAVSLSGTAGIVGSPRHTDASIPQSGAAYIYEP
jgi:hypothetical protein